jgi:hypothetical protein
MENIIIVDREEQIITRVGTPYYKGGEWRVGILFKEKQKMNTTIGWKVLNFELEEQAQKYYEDNKKINQVEVFNGTDVN